jgi:hypothetical protein
MVVILLYPPVMWQHAMCVCLHCVPCREVGRLPIMHGATIKIFFMYASGLKLLAYHNETDYFGDSRQGS